MHHYQNKISAPLTKPLDEESHGKFATNPPAHPPFQKAKCIECVFSFWMCWWLNHEMGQLALFCTPTKKNLSLSCEEPTFVQNKPCNSATLSGFRFHTNPLISPGMISMKQSSFKVIGVSKLQRWFLTFLSTFRSNTNPPFILMIKKTCCTMWSYNWSHLASHSPACLVVASSLMSP